MIGNFPAVYQRDEYDCGKACLEGLFDYWNRPKPRSYVHSPIDGMDPRTLETYCRRAKLSVLAGEMTVQDLRYFSQTLRPVICLIRSGSVGHYVVVTGVRYRTVYFHDPIDGLQTKSQHYWLEHWYDLDRSGATWRQFGLCAWEPNKFNPNPFRSLPS